MTGTGTDGAGELGDPAGDRGTRDGGRGIRDGGLITPDGGRGIPGGGLIIHTDHITREDGLLYRGVRPAAPEAHADTCHPQAPLPTTEVRQGAAVHTVAADIQEAATVAAVPAHAAVPQAVQHPEAEALQETAG